MEGLINGNCILLMHQHMCISCSKILGKKCHNDVTNIFTRYVPLQSFSLLQNEKKNMKEQCSVTVESIAQRPLFEHTKMVKQEMQSNNVLKNCIRWYQQVSRTCLLYTSMFFRFIH